MVSLKFVIPAAAAAMMSTTAFAADLGIPYQPPMVAEQPLSGWYLRGDIGVGMTGNYSLDYLPAPADVGDGFVFDQHSMADTVFYNAGIGYEFNNWLRFDFTGEYRDKTQINARGIYDTFTGQGDSYQGYLKSWVFLANGYIDLATWDCITPFIGAGIGSAYNTMSNLVDSGIGTTGYGLGRNSSNWSPAYAFYAGLDYSVSQNFKVELAYRYLSYGSVTDTVDCACGGPSDSYKFDHLSSQDLMLGFRWLLSPGATPAMPIETKG